ncbi:MAG: GNAT family N-acetyltransferase [Candidatus Bathyarchaeota archaeon]|nr:GNAT family N-acetyltransferase [Candidatus Bathyarchaeota archaeon]
MDEKKFLDYLDKNRVLHVFTIYDLKYMREKMRVWVAFRNCKVTGYLLQFDKKIIHTHGDEDGMAELLRFVEPDEPAFVIEPHHLATVERFFKPVKPTDDSSKGKITKYFVIMAKADTFKPMIRHRVKKLGHKDFDEVSESLGEEYGKRVENAVRRGLAFGAYDGGRLVSLATVPEIIQDLALIRGVYTVPPFRGGGFATSACSALVKEIIRLGKKPMLWVARDNLPARRVYNKVGFKETGHALLGFKAKKL